MKKIAIFNIIDTYSRFVCGVVLEDQSTSGIMNHLRIGYKCFENNKSISNQFKPIMW